MISRRVAIALVIDGGRPVTLQIDGAHQAMQVQTISSAGDGEWQSYPAGNTPLASAEAPRRRPPRPLVATWRRSSTLSSRLRDARGDLAARVIHAN